MANVTIDKDSEKKHAPLARSAAGAIENQPGGGAVFLCDVGAMPTARRRDDWIVSMEQSDVPGIERAGTGHCHIKYPDPHSAAGRAAIIAAAATPGQPVCADPESIALLTLAQRVAASEIPVLIDGPTGTGKEVLARFIHNHSARASRPFVAINCAAMPEAMLEAMLFGHLKGAFTGAAQASEGFFRAADGGTLLLDEIAEMPIGLQAKLLRVLQEGEVVPIGATMPISVDVRVIAAANRDLPTEVAEGRLRADLYYRLNVFPLSLQALRMRAGDIGPLAFAMLMRHGPATGALPWITDAALDKLRGHTWPGNIRELENVIRRAVLLSSGADTISAQDITFDTPARALPPEGQGQMPAPSSSPLSAPASSTPASSPPSGPLSSIVRQSEAEAILATLDECGGKRVDTARRLGISERTLRYRMASMRDAGLIEQRSYAGATR